MPDRAHYRAQIVPGKARIVTGRLDSEGGFRIKTGYYYEFSQETGEQDTKQGGLINKWENTQKSKLTTKLETRLNQTTQSHTLEPKNKTIQ